MAAVWPFIADRCTDPRWHEVIRLLLGALERTESQRYLLERILPKDADEGYLERACLAGGCLLDGIDAAEEMTEEVVTSLLTTAARAGDVDALRKPLRVLRAWQDRAEGNRSLLGELAKRVHAKANKAAVRDAATLNLVSLGWDDEAVKNSLGPTLGLSGPSAGLYAGLLAEQPPDRPWVTPQESELLHALQSVLGLSGIEGDFFFLAVSLAALCRPGNASSPCPVYTQLLGNAVDAGQSLSEQVRFCVICALSVTTDHGKGGLARALGRQIDQARSLALDEALDRVRLLGGERPRARGRARGRARARALNRAVRLARAIGWTRVRYWSRALDRVLALAQYRHRIRDWVHSLDQDRAEAHEFWPLVLRDADMHSPLLDCLCDLLGLSPQAAWWEALRVRALPRVPERITLVNPEVWNTTEAAFADGNATEMHCYHAASQLLLDVWLWLAGSHDGAEESPFRRLAELTRDVDSAPLRVSHCLRDLACGYQSRIDDLVAMVNSNDPEYRKLFQEAFWRD